MKIPTGGRVSLNITKMTRRDLSIVLSTAIYRVLKEKKEAIYHNIVLKDNNQTKTINLIAKPFDEPTTRQQLVMLQFEEVRSAPQTLYETELYDVSKSASQRIIDLEQELQYSRENLQATIEELETSNEELQATNEELLAANEELQSTNEELQSVNEELITVNSEYQLKIKELTDLNNDVNNSPYAVVDLLVTDLQSVTDNPRICNSPGNCKLPQYRLRIANP